ncbi:MAG: L-serine ammonia-lyase, partial [Planctomycetales bacterium]|nr:L-serine ammonia-lyase [Planctomycetales bacterium]
MSNADEQLSVFDMLKIGIGPSSSHTLGPWRAAQRFLRELPGGQVERVERVAVDLYGSLSKTGRGHGADIAVQLGLLGADPETFETSRIKELVKRVADSKWIALGGSHGIPFDPAADIRFHNDRLP